MSERQSPVGPLIALCGAALLLASLWLPWYEIRLPELLREAFKTFGEGAGGVNADQANPLAGLFSGLASAIPESVEVSGWLGMEQADVALALAASFALLAGLAGGGFLGSAVRVEGGAAGRLIALAGAVSLAVVVFHVVTRPAVNIPGATDLVALRQGIWAALLGSGLMLAGGLLTASGQSLSKSSPGWNAATPAESAAWAGPAITAAEPEAAAGTPLYTATPASSLAPPGWS